MTNAYLVRLGVVSGLVLPALNVGCWDDKPNLTTDTDSRAFVDRAKKLGFLRRYVKLPTEVRNVEFSIVYRDNSHGLVPGPSDWDIRYIVRVDPQDVDAWLYDPRPAKLRPESEARLAAMIDDRPGWRRTGRPTYFRQRDRAYVIVYRKDGIVYKELSTTPSGP